MSSLLIENAVLDGERTAIRCEGGVISEIGDGASGAAATETIDAAGMIAHPPLANCHTHAAMTLFRGGGDDLPLMEWLETRVWPYEKRMTEQEVYWGARLAIVEMLRAGTVFFNDMYWHPEATIRAAEDAGVRAQVAAVFIDFGDPDAAKRQRAENERLLAGSRERSGRVRVAIGPHAIYTVSEPSLRWAGEFAAEHGLMLHVHLAETEREVADCRDEHGCTPVAYLDRLGLLAERTVAAHAVWLTDEDVSILGERQVVCAHNPVSNMKLAVGGRFRYAELRDVGAVPVIATDGAGSNNNLDLLEELKVAALAQKAATGDPTALPAAEAMRMAVENPAEAFGLGARIEPEAPADLVLIDPAVPELNPPADLASHLVYSASGSAVDTVVCDGRVLMRGREVPGADEIVARAREAARAMVARVDR